MSTQSINSSGVGLTDLLSANSQRQDPAEHRLTEVLDRLRQRWRLRCVLEGLFATLAIMLALFVVAAWLLDQWNFADPAVWTLRGLLVISLCGLLLQFCAKPLRRQVSDARIAMYLQEHEPALRSIVLSAVDVRHAAPQDISPGLASRLVEQALEACARVDFGLAIEQRNLARAASKLVLATFVIVILWAFPPAFLKLSATALLKPWTDASEYWPYRVEIAPGNIEIARGEDLLISASIDGYDGDEVWLFTSADGGDSWQRTDMAAGSRAGRYESFLFDLERPRNYYVNLAGHDSDIYRIDVADIPAIGAISLSYHYPAYTLLAPTTSRGSGDISALRGTRVEVRITPTVAIPGGALLLDDGQRVELAKSDDDWTGELRVERDGAYRVTLQRAGGTPVDASTEFRITALEDGYPGVSILSPGRDTRVSMIEEPVMQVRASDDQGIARLELVMTVNGAAEQRIALQPAPRDPGAAREFDAEHLLYLEDLELQPGDLISYYVQAEDLAPSGQSRTATSDIFFYQVRPFSLNYRSAEQQGGGGGGGAQGGQQQDHLSDQQKQFVVATFKMIRDRDRYDAETYRQNLELLARAQARIRDRVEAIVRRLGSRPMIQLDQRYRVITTELPLAAEAMIEVEKQLQETEIEPALADAQVALLHLQRADAAFRDINVALANQGGAGSASSAGMEELADLFQLEMDKLRHQYDTVQRAQQPSPAQSIDETLERLRELAQRQQREIERQLRRQGSSANDSSRERQLALAEELEAMARRLEKLSRTQPNPQLQQSIEQMRNAAEAMRQAASSAGGGGVDQSRQAAANLREAQRLLDQSRVRQFSDAVERSLRRAELAEKRQARIRQEVEQLDDNWSAALESRLDQLDRQKQVLADELSKLEAELSQLAATAREEQPQADQPLKQALRAGRENRLHDRIGRTRNMVQLGEKAQALDNESKIQQGIGKMREQIEQALAQVAGPGERGLQRSLEHLRNLARELRSMREQASRDSAGRGNGTLTPSGGAWSGYPDLRRQLEGFAGSAQALGQDLRELGIEAGDIEAMLDRISELIKAQNERDDPASAGLHEQALTAIKELEFKLRQRLESPDRPEPLLAEPTEIADEYRDLIADYFRELSRP